MSSKSSEGFETSTYSPSGDVLSSLKSCYYQHCFPYYFEFQYGDGFHNNLRSFVFDHYYCCLEEVYFGFGYCYYEVGYC